jgi:septum formation protein
MLYTSNKKIILASNSPRRKELLASLEIDFEVKTQDVDESYSETMRIDEVAEHLALKKANGISLGENEILISADTTVLFQGRILNKPINQENAIQMLQKLSGNEHRVITGVCIKSNAKMESFSETTTVFFKELSDAEIEYYVFNHNPLDKAGGYGIQDWIGQIGIRKIEGCYYNVVGLPTNKLYHKLIGFI